MEKLYIERVSKCNEPNRNNVIYSEEIFQKSLKERFDQLGYIAITGNPLLYDIFEISIINPMDILGRIVDLHDIKPDGIDIVPNNGKEDLLKDMINRRYKLGLRYISNNPQLDMVGNIHLTNMKIISYDMLSPSQYGIDESDIL